MSFTTIPSKYQLLIKPLAEGVEEFYDNVGTKYVGDAGIDIHFPHDFTVEAHSTAWIPLGISCQMLKTIEGYPFTSVTTRSRELYTPDYVSYFLFPRSSIGRTPLRLANSIGLIDSAYTGELSVYVDNIRDEDYTVKRGERLFQLVPPSPDCENAVSAKVVSEFTRVTTRGAAGFGSSGN
jgi:dUTP pyrophosphatase